MHWQVITETEDTIDLRVNLAHWIGIGNETLITHHKVLFLGYL